MLIAEKPPLDEDLLVHFGIKGMKWGVRREKATAAFKQKVGSISNETKIKATVAVGSAATVGVLYATGNLKAATVGTGKLALAGAKSGGKVLVKSGQLAVKGAFVGTKFVVGGAAKLTGRALGGSFRAVFGSGKKAAEATMEASGKRSLKSILRIGRKGEGPAKSVLQNSGKRSLRSLMGLKPKAPLKLYPTTSIMPPKIPKSRLQLHPAESIFTRRRSSTLRDAARANDGVTQRLLRSTRRNLSLATLKEQIASPSRASNFGAPS